MKMEIGKHEMDNIRKLIDHSLKIMINNNSYNCRLWQYHHHKNTNYFSIQITRSSEKINIIIEDIEGLKNALEENFFELFTLDKVNTIFTGPIFPGEYLDKNGQWVYPLTD